MTNKQTGTSGLVEVIQADRDAAAAWCRSQPFPSKQAEAPMIEAGEYDHHSLVQALARHRLASLSPVPVDEVERLTEELAQMLMGYPADDRGPVTQAREFVCKVAALTASRPSDDGEVE